LYVRRGLFHKSVDEMALVPRKNVVAERIGWAVTKKF